MRRNIFLFTIALGWGLAGCASTQNENNTIDMAGGVSRVREAQVLRNIAVAISDHNIVPSQVLLGQGQSTIDFGATPTLKLPGIDFAHAAKELDIASTDTWHAQWDFTSVTDADDLRRLRSLYSLIASTDDQYSLLEQYMDRHYPIAQNDPKYTCDQIIVHPELAKERNPTIGTRQGNAPSWPVSLCYMKLGDSIGCKLYQEGYVPRNDASRNLKGFPIRRWLYWRGQGTDWLPSSPESEPQSLGTYGDWEIGVTSRACFDDFVILVQGQLAKTQEQEKHTITPGILPLH